MEKYIVITCTEDGVTIDAYTKQELEDDIDDLRVEWMDELPENSDPCEWGWCDSNNGTGIIIKGGRVVTPEAVETVTRWEV